MENIDETFPLSYVLHRMTWMIKHLHFYALSSVSLLNTQVFHFHRQFFPLPSLLRYPHKKFICKMRQRIDGVSAHESSNGNRTLCLKGLAFVSRSACLGTFSISITHEWGWRHRPSTMFTTTRCGGNDTSMGCKCIRECVLIVNTNDGSINGGGKNWASTNSLNGIVKSKM